MDDFQLTPDEQRFVVEAIQTSEQLDRDLTELMICLNVDDKAAYHAPVTDFATILPIGDKSAFVDANDSWVLLRLHGEFFLTTRKTQRLAPTFAHPQPSDPN